MPHADIAAIDFETATSQRSSACAIGLAVPQTDGTIIGKSWLIRPPGNEYDDFNISIHGIRPEDTVDAPSIAELWGEVAESVGDRMLVAHNAAFDMSVLRRSFEAHDSGIADEYDYLCTYRLARSVWPDRWSYRLVDIAGDLGLPTDQHHDPAWDAYAAVEIANAMTTTLGVESLTDVAQRQGFRIGRIYTDSTRWDPFSGAARGGGGSGASWKASEVAARGEEFDTDHPLFGLRVVITGALPNGMSRREAYQCVVDHGGQVADAVSKKVNILVVADLNPVVVGEDGRSGKLRKAIQLAESGVPIELMDARDFIPLLGT
jgi:DNA polymerase-3 subunit epsilon